MGDIRAVGALGGFVSAVPSLVGELSSVGALSGKVSASREYDIYGGEYLVVPRAFEEQVLPTSNRVLKEDVVVREVPFYEVSNDSDGVTAYIGKDVGNGL